MFGWLFGKKEVKRVEEETKKGFESVKNDINNVSKWIKHLDEEDKKLENEVSEIKDILSSIKLDVEGLKNALSIMSGSSFKQLSKQPRKVSKQQTGVEPVYVPVQTAVQTPNLEQFSITERAIIWILLNTDMKLSYEDLSAMLGKEKSTIRGQINAIKQKSEDLIEEIIERGGKKRVYIPENMKDFILKRSKVRVKSDRKSRKKTLKIKKDS